MTYYFTKTVDMSFDDAVMSTKEALTSSYLQHVIDEVGNATESALGP